MRDEAEFFQHLDLVGFNPKTIVDVGVARGTPAIYKAFPDAHYVLVDPVKEYEGEMQRILTEVNGEYHLCALSDRAGEMEMMIREPFYVSSLQYDRESLRDENMLRTVPVRTLEEILAWQAPSIVDTWERYNNATRRCGYERQTLSGRVQT